MILVLMLRVILQILVYRHGFLSLTADDFGRVLLADHWSKTNLINWFGNWLPVYLVFFGSFLKVFRDLLWTPRLIAAGCGIAALVMMYFLCAQLFKNSLVALLSMFLFAVSPAAIWLSSTPLTEMPYTLLVLVFLTAFIRYWETDRYRYLILSALILSLASGLRFEAWVLTGLFGLLLFGRIARRVHQKKLQRREWVLASLSILIVGIVPVLWSLGNYLHYGDPFFYFSDIKSYKSIWYGHDVSFFNYLKILFLLDPWLTSLGAFAFLFSLWRSRKSNPVLVYMAYGFLPFIIFILLHGGQNEPTGNYIRYLAPFLFPLYPLFARLLLSFTNRLIKPKNLAKLGLTLLVLGITLTQLLTTFNNTNDPSSLGLAVGTALKELRANRPELADRFVVIELTYWRYLAIQVGANDTTHILYDRLLDLKDRKTSSYISSDWAVFNSCLTEYNVSFIILRDPALQKIVEENLAVQPVKIVGDYAFYDLTRNPPQAAGQAPTCPLRPGWGY